MKIKRLAWPFAAIVLTGLYPSCFHYLHNAREALPREILPMFCTFLVTGLVIWLVAGLILKSPEKGGVFACLALLAVENLGLLSGALKGRFWWMRDLYLFAGAAVVFLLLLLLLRKWKKAPGKELCQILTVVFAGLTLVQFIMAVPTLYKIISFHPETGGPNPEEVEFQSDCPNFYYVLTDEYGGTENLERYFDFDNAEFLDFLREEDFSVSEYTHNTESLWTVSLMANMLNLNYVADLQKGSMNVEERIIARFTEHPNLVEIFRHNGYEINLINHQDYPSCLGCHELTPDQRADTITRFVFENSAFSVMPKVRTVIKNLMHLKDNADEVASIREVFDVMEHVTDYVSDKPTFTLAYVNSPHYPFLFDAEGNEVGEVSQFQAHHYIDYLLYLNTEFEAMIRDIRENDPDAVIVIQSDHGARYPALMLIYGGLDYDPIVETPYMQNPLNVVYAGGEPLDIEGLSAINTLRKLLNERFGTDLEMLDSPEGYTCYIREWTDTPLTYEEAMELHRQMEAEAAENP